MFINKSQWEHPSYPDKILTCLGERETQSGNMIVEFQILGDRFPISFGFKSEFLRGITPYVKPPKLSIKKRIVVNIPDNLTPEQRAVYLQYCSKKSQEIQAALITRGNATLLELLQDCPGVYPSTASRTIRYLRLFGHRIVPSTDLDGATRFWLDSDPPLSFSRSNCARRSEIMNWLSLNPGFWKDEEIATGLGLDVNKSESVGAAVRVLLQEGKLAKEYVGKIRRVSEMAKAAE